jgi:hypothetical protein
MLMTAHASQTTKTPFISVTIQQGSILWALKWQSNEMVTMAEP